MADDTPPAATPRASKNGPADRAKNKSGKTARTAKPANKRAVARLAAVQALYQMDVAGGGARDIIKEFELFRLRQDVEGETLRAIDLKWFEDLVAGVVAHQRDIDGHIDRALKEGWPLARIDLTLRALLRGAVYELTRQEDVPARVAITEYVEVAKAFFGDEEPRLVNGVLDKIARKVRPGEFKASAGAQERARRSG
ncbi:MAG: transcription antitermination factor NusB [Pseudomonadota bacterium]